MRLWKGKSKFYREFMTTLIKYIFRTIVLILLLVGAVYALFQIN